MERLSSVLPAVAMAAGRAKDALEPARRFNSHSLDTRDYDRQVMYLILPSYMLYIFKAREN